MKIFISGATGVVGRALALELVRADPSVELILNARHAANLTALDDSLQAAGAQPALLVPLDWTTATAAHAKELAQSLEDEGLDALVLAAATHTGLHPLDHLKPIDFDRILRVGLYAPYWLLHHLLPLLKRSPSGRILAVSDAVGAEGKPFWGAYGAAKSGLDTLLRQVAAEAEGQVAVQRVVPPPIGSRLRGLVYPAEDPHSLADPAAVTRPWASWLLHGA